MHDIKCFEYKAYNTAYILLFIKYNTIHRMYGIFGPSEVHALHGTRCPLYMAFFSSKATLKTTQWVFFFFFSSTFLKICAS